MLRTTRAAFFAFVLSTVATAATAAAQTTIYESATLGPTGQADGAYVGEVQWVGAKFETTVGHRVSTLGAHFFTRDGDVWIGVFPVDTTTGLPPNPPSSDDAHFAGIIPGSIGLAGTEEHTLTTDFFLPAGRWAVVMGAGSLGATGRGGLARLNPNVGSPSLIAGRISEGTWADISTTELRFFLLGSEEAPIDAGTDLGPDAGIAPGDGGETTSDSGGCSTGTNLGLLPLVLMALALATRPRARRLPR